MEEPAPFGVQPLVHVGAEVVPLGLQQVRGQKFAGVAVEVGQAGAHGGYGDAVSDGGRGHVPPGGKEVLHEILEVGVEDEVGEPGVPVEGFLDLPEEDAADDAPRPPDEGDAAVVELPVVGLRGRPEEGIPLGVGNDLGGKKGLPDFFQKFVPVAVEGGLFPGKFRGGGHPFVLHGGEAPGEDGLADEGEGNPFVQGRDAHPLACPLLPGGVEDLVHQGKTVHVFVGEDVPGDLDEVAVQVRLVEFPESFVHLAGSHAQHVPHEVVGFTDELHVAVLDAVVDHLDEVACPVGAHPFAAGGAVFNPGADGLEDVFDMGPGCGRPAGHHGGPLQGAFLSSADSGADIEQSLALHVGRPADGVGEVAVSSVDEDVSLFHEGQKVFDHFVHGLARLDHHHDLPGAFEARYQVLEEKGAENVLPLRPAFDKIGNLVRGTVEHGDGVSPGLHVHDEVFSHDRQADEADIRLFHGTAPFPFQFPPHARSGPYRFTRALPSQTLQTCSSLAGTAKS
ncbi:hypothetical protein SDC9_66640 [bioreactor metagenome]|uniref:Uncharacterized protein n=1 Tax=bioreactor metagenome TaxID=1076179 RepID=A0A644XX14_9ZZZZ